MLVFTSKNSETNLWEDGAKKIDNPIPLNIMKTII